jgi:hypothetical protein
MASPMLWLGVKPGLRRFPSEVDPWELFKTSGEAGRAAGVSWSQAPASPGLRCWPARCDAAGAPAHRRSDRT